MTRALPLAALLLTGCLLQPTQAPDCAAATYCGECIGRAGCGWCEGTSACVPGSSFGPDDPSCALPDWRFTGCDRPPGAVGDCHRHDDCGGCLYDLGDNPDCQWCPATGQCLNLDETCVFGAATHEYDLCRSSTCTAQTTCDACTSMGTDCRWCDVGGGVCTDSYECDPHYEFGSRDRCPPPNGCSSHFGCDDCLAAGCGWCDAPGGSTFCVAVDGFGDYADWCSLDLYIDACP
ncbi:MAG: hypothetical protein R3B82_03240 [Sandaracinaceae bacterium]